MYRWNSVESGVRVSSMEKQEAQIKKMYESLGSELNEALRGYQ